MLTTFINTRNSGIGSKRYVPEVLKTRLSGFWTRSNVYDLINNIEILCLFKSYACKILETWICRFGNRSNANEILLRDVGTNVMFKRCVNLDSQDSGTDYLA